LRAHSFVVATKGELLLKRRPLACAADLCALEHRCATGSRKHVGEALAALDAERQRVTSQVLERSVLMEADRLIVQTNKKIALRWQ
jgi:hypothetical protein